MKTSELTEAALDWAVAKCEGVINGDDLDIGFIRERGYTPSTDWAQGGPIIERECISIYEHGYWVAEIDLSEGDAMIQTSIGDTPLIAAMRCYVASKFGDEVEVPEELQPSLSRDSF